MLGKKSKIKKPFLKIEDVERLDKIFARHSDKVSYKIVDGKAVILNLEDGSYFSLDEAGTIMWELFTENKSLAEVAKETARFFKVGRKGVCYDLLELVNELTVVDLLELKDDAIQKTRKKTPEPTEV